MKCPFCEYDEENTDTDLGDFWEMIDDVKMERHLYTCKHQEREVHGCPKCGGLFIKN